MKSTRLPNVENAADLGHLIGELVAGNYSSQLVVDGTYALGVKINGVQFVITVEARAWERVTT